eukprot:TRINITY_DN5573_c0_g1_i1.p1 TRINITY_DN5573_c0_g1~~TRINITY_DN5573_c0_g1_i1.p1  ORF type:complete len:339 (-),score=66.28 TRINITY_DN5573_c0_g1_i1:27-1022(-)
MSHSPVFESLCASPVSSIGEDLGSSSERSNKYCAGVLRVRKPVAELAAYSPAHEWIGDRPNCSQQLEIATLRRELYVVRCELQVKEERLRRFAEERLQRVAVTEAENPLLLVVQEAWDARRAADQRLERAAHEHSEKLTLLEEEVRLLKEEVVAQSVRADTAEKALWVERAAIKSILSAEDMETQTEEGELACQSGAAELGELSLCEGFDDKVALLELALNEAQIMAEKQAAATKRAESDLALSVELMIGLRHELERVKSALVEALQQNECAVECGCETNKENVQETKAENVETSEPLLKPLPVHGSPSIVATTLVTITLTLLFLLFLTKA